MRSRPYLPFFAAPAVVYVAVLLVVALLVRPPLVGWIGLAVVAAIGLAITGLAAALYPRSRTNAPRLHPHPDGRMRLLVVADAHCDGSKLCRAVEQFVPGRDADVFVVSPLLPSALHFLADDERDAAVDARARLDEALQGLARIGVAARGVVGADDPLQAVGDALAVFPAGHVLLAPSRRGRRHWLERDLERQVRDAFGVGVSSVAASGGAESAPGVAAVAG
jgi:hypothetical protein